MSNGWAIANYFKAATTPPPRDPLVLDLDGDGIETIGTDPLNPVLFDHNGDGIKTGTGWIKSDDGLLVMDRDSNGSIDTGSELFGADTVLTSGAYAGRKALDGFVALRDLDSNPDGVMDANDAQFANLKVWRDLNQDGVSGANELFTLADLNIASISLAKTAATVNLGNGNTQTATSGFTRTDGTTGTVANLNLASDTFHREYVTPVAISAAAALLPGMQGSGRVRDLREAASQSTVLEAGLAQYSQATTRAEQVAQLDGLLKAWSDSSDMPDSIEQIRAAAAGGVVIFAENISKEWHDRIVLLERFNGRTISDRLLVSWVTGPEYHIQQQFQISQDQYDLLQQSYDALKESVYESLVLQTRLKPLLDTIALSFTNDTLALDFSGLQAEMQTRIAADPVTGIQDLVDFNRATGSAYIEAGWSGWSMLETTLRTTAMTPDLQAALTDLGIQMYGQAGYTGTGGTKRDIIVGGSLSDYILGGAGNDALLGGDGNDTMYGQDGNDVLQGGPGNDYLDGGAGNDVLVGGAGNDTMFGGDGSDTYLFGRGSGQDTISYYGVSAGSSDAIVLDAGVTPGDVIVKRSGDALILAIADTTDTLTVVNYFYGSAGDHPFKVDQIKFSDGTAWDFAAVSAMAEMPTEGADILHGAGGDDAISGLGGDDSIYGGKGNDALGGGDGNDVLDGGAGNDTLDGGAGSDTYLFDRGAGQDSVSNYDTTAGKTDAIQFGAGVLPTDIAVTRSGNDLVLAIKGSTDQIKVQYYFAAAGYMVDQFKFADGTVWGTAEIKAQAVTYGTAAADSITGYNGGPNQIYGLDGNDYLTGGDGADLIDGGTGNDSLSGNAGNDALQGGEGNDALGGGDGNDVLDGGAGNDTLDGGAGSDTYLFDRGAGQDSVSNYDTTAGKTDAIQFGAGVLPTDIAVTRSGNDLVLAIKGSTDQIKVQYYFAAAGYMVDQFKFADGTVWGAAEIKAQAITYAYGTAGTDYIAGYNGGPNQIYGLDGNDYLYGGDGNDLIDGGTGNDALSGYAGNDVLQGGAGNDTLDGGAGSDTYLFDRGAGQDSVSNYDTTAGKTDAIQFGAGVLPTDIAVTRSGNDLVLAIKGSTDQIKVQYYFAAAGYMVDQFKFADGTVWGAAEIKAQAITYAYGTAGTDYIAGYNGGPNQIYGLDGNDYLYGGDGNDLIDGGTGNDALSGYAGNDVLQGGAGADSLNDNAGNNLLYAGADGDTLTGATGNELFIGGAGNETIATGTGYDILAFNRGDGQDVVAASTGADNTISIGGGIRYSDLAFRKSANDLILDTGAGEQITLQGWYAAAANKSVVNLQMIEEAAADFNAASADPLLNNKIEQFNFAGLAGRFDQALAATPALTSWSLTNALLDFHIGESETAALGGDLAYQYGKTGSLATVGLTAAQGILGSAQFGSVPQALLAQASLQAGVALG
jgi:Ca2+-binding RTX toxin-like protein